MRVTEEKRKKEEIFETLMTKPLPKIISDTKYRSKKLKEHQAGQM